MTPGVNKVYNLEDLCKIRSRLRKEGKKVVFTNGCFDLLHSGHILLFKKAKELGDILVVGVNDDNSVQKIKGENRPVFPLKERLEILNAIQDVDYLISFSETTPQNIISTLLPDVLVKGGDWKPEQVIGKKEVEKVGGEVKIIPFHPGHSTTQIIYKILRSVKD